MTSVAIIGAGELGGATASALARRASADRVVLVDGARDVAAGKALDIMQAGAITGSPVRLDAAADQAALSKCDVCVIADPIVAGAAKGPAEATLLARLASLAGPAPIVVADADQADQIESVAGTVAASRLVGSGGLAVTAAAAVCVALEVGCSVREVSLVVLGAPPSRFVVSWSQASVSGVSLEAVLTPPQVRRLEAKIAGLWPPGPYAFGVAAARVVEAILTSSRASVSVLTMIDGAFGVRRRVGVLPALLTPGGISRVVEPHLTPRELSQVHTALRW